MNYLYKNWMKIKEEEKKQEAEDIKRIKNI